jgi:hypothetical protein
MMMTRVIHGSHGPVGNDADHHHEGEYSCLHMERDVGFEGFPLSQQFGRPVMLVSVTHLDYFIYNIDWKSSLYYIIPIHTKRSPPPMPLAPAFSSVAS